MAPITAHVSSLLSQIERSLEEPTRTLLSGPSLVHRQDTNGGTVTVLAPGPATTTAPAQDPDPTGAKTLSGGAIAGIVIGSIAGFLLLVWIFRSCSNLGAPPGSENANGKAWYDGVRDERPARHVEPVEYGRRSRSRSGHRHHHHHSRSRSVRRSGEMREVVPVTIARERSPRRPPGVYDYGSGGSRRDRRSRDRGY
ncbi:hypothetical protein QBC47DRAFT_403322 [Echria macrotheca]|uniref:Uncharacterized protein n=1 Tax=Echria macrotheca TaxID=438768 RepID=A0AAJ0F822_9PEZI|nr:hypothetical protein QBC47DRAFT_403322 [Echria macrotheca]